MESNLEQLIEKSTKARESVARTLLKNFPIEEDFANFLAMDVVNQAIGVDALERYNESKRLEAQRKEEKELERRRQIKRQGRLATLRSVLGVTLKGVVPSVLALLLVVWAISGMYSCATKSPYPRTYTPFTETVRFADEKRTGFQDKSVDGLDDDSLLCIRGFAYYIQGNVNDQTAGCIHRNKLSALNNALDKAVKEDINGVVWEEPNGNGEVWTIVRNNYRFVVTANRDENFIEP